MVIEVTTSNLFGMPKYDVYRGTKMTIDKISKSSKASSGTYFHIKDCESYPQLVGEKICSSLFENPHLVIKQYFSSEQQTVSNNRVLLLII